MHWADEPMLRFVEMLGAAARGLPLLVLCTARIYTPILTQPPDSIDSNMMNALSALVAAYTDGFTLGALVKQIDLLGQYGTPLSAASGYQDWDNTQYRVITLTIPVVVNDVWIQSA